MQEYKSKLNSYNENKYSMFPQTRRNIFFIKRKKRFLNWNEFIKQSYGISIKLRKQELQ